MPRPGARAAGLVAVLLLASACRVDSGPEEPPTSRVTAGIIGGRVSGDDENAAVAIETRSSENAGQVLRCSGRIIAPGSS